jgi:tetratricopeptide (TPR) repeat protein
MELESYANDDEASWSGQIDYEQGETFRKAKDYAAAIQCYNRATALNPKYVHAYYGKGITLYAMGKKEDAMKIYDRILTMNPNYSKAHLSKGNVLSDFGNAEEALDCFNRASSIDPKFSSVSLIKKGEVLSNLGRNEEAIECFHKALPQFEKIHLKSSRCPHSSWAS